MKRALKELKENENNIMPVTNGISKGAVKYY